MIAPAHTTPLTVAWARAYAAMGLHPLRLHAPVMGDLKSGKRPVGNGWQNAAFDLDVLCAELAANPASNLGLRMGVQADGRCLIALDIDDLEAFQLRAGSLGALPPTFATKTGKGFHGVFEVDSDVLPRLTNFTKRDGVDARVQGGQIAVPPSLHPSGVHYQSMHTPMLAPARLTQPWVEWLLACSAARPRVDVETDCPADLTRDDRWLAEARDHAGRLPIAVAGAGGTALFTAASVLMRGWLLTRDGADQVLREVWNPLCRPPWDFADQEHVRNWDHQIDDAESRGYTEWGSCRPLLGLSGYADTPAAAMAVGPGPGTADSDMPDPRLVASAAAWARWMNAKHTVLTQIGGKCMVMSRYEGMPVLQSFEAFRNRYLNLNAYIEGALNKDGEPKPVPVADWWLRQRERDEALTLCFRPDCAERLVDGCLNTWSGYAVAPRAGAWPIMRQFIRDIVASGNDVHEAYIMRWVTWVVQNPGRRAEVVLVLRGKRGVGKNTLFDAICAMFGKHSKTVSNPKHLTGAFNAHLQNCAFLFANEALPPNDKPSEQVMKALITDRTIAIERKGVDVEDQPNVLSIGMASNEGWCVPAGFNERRFAVFDISDARMQDTAYFGTVLAELDGGGRAAMLHDLLATDLQGWHPRDGVPQTSSLVDQQLASLRGADRVVYHMLADGRNPGRVQGETINPVPGYEFVCTRLAAKETGRDVGFETALGRALAKCSGPGAAQSRISVKAFGMAVTYRGRWLPPLAEARENWARCVGLNVDWPEADCWV